MIKRAEFFSDEEINCRDYIHKYMDDHSKEIIRTQLLKTGLSAERVDTYIQKYYTIKDKKEGIESLDQNKKLSYKRIFYLIVILFLAFVFYFKIYVWFGIGVLVLYNLYLNFFTYKKDAIENDFIGSHLGFFSRNWDYFIILMLFIVGYYIFPLYLSLIMLMTLSFNVIWLVYTDVKALSLEVL